MELRQQLGKFLGITNVDGHFSLVDLDLPLLFIEVDSIIPDNVLSEIELLESESSNYKDVNVYSIKNKTLFRAIGDFIIDRHFLKKSIRLFDTANPGVLPKELITEAIDGVDKLTYSSFLGKEKKEVVAIPVDDELTSRLKLSVDKLNQRIKKQEESLRSKAIKIINDMIIPEIEREERWPVRVTIPRRQNNHQLFLDLVNDLLRPAGLVSEYAANFGELLVYSSAN